MTTSVFELGNLIEGFKLSCQTEGKSPRTVEWYSSFLARDNYTKVIVTWGWEDGILKQAKEAGVELWDFRTVINDIAEDCKDPTYFTDDTLRTVQLFQRARYEG